MGTPSWSRPSRSAPPATRGRRPASLLACSPTGRPTGTRHTMPSAVSSSGCTRRFRIGSGRPNRIPMCPHCCAVAPTRFSRRWSRRQERSRWPPRVAREKKGGPAARGSGPTGEAQMSDCIFCKIAEKKIPSKIAHEDDRAVAFEDINPQAPVHVLVVPKRHVQSVAELNAADAGFLGHLLLTGAAIAKQRGIADSGYRLVLNTGKHGGQTVFHLHVHVLGGRPMHWPPG